ncbi:beta-hexosaminidase-like [Ylistrum balloti]|uniref:beta-hexosaminidase-like n=1 Tax=Ylistrum balloti TaxID=509963 RepID=UPI002905BC7E|nr:beta-hexosaminidase-like [Ylistrum balloti]
MALQTSGSLCLLILVHVVGTTSANVETLAKDVRVMYYLINHNPGGSYYAAIILTNNGTSSIDHSGDWSLYVCHENLIEFKRFDSDTGEYEFPTRRGGFSLSHIEGCMYKFTPDPNSFGTINPGRSRYITFLTSASITGKYDIFPNFYIANTTNSAKVIQNTKADLSREFVGPFQNLFQYTRNPPRDPILPVSLSNRYSGLVKNIYPKTTQGDIIPTPRMKYESPQKKVYMNSTWKIDSRNDARISVLMEYFTSTLDMTETTTPLLHNVILLQLKAAPAVENYHEWYNITISADHSYVHIVGNTTHGLLNGFQTVLHLIEKEEHPKLGRQLAVPQMKIVDSPRFQYRGLQLDTASNFINMTTLKKLLHVMAFLKLNKLQLLLANDYGVRLEITTMSHFHTVGSTRCHDEAEESCLFSQLGSDPSGNGLGSGYYTAKEYIELLSIAKRLHIEIIPMWSFDRNMRASEIAMRAYSKATNDNTMNWSLPTLDKTSQLKPNLFRLGKVDPCAVETERFIRNIISTIKSYHAEAGYPLKTFGVGGEDTDVEAWLDKCNARNKTNNLKHPYIRRKVQFSQMLSKVATDNDLVINAYDNMFTAFPNKCLDPNDCPNWFVPFNISKWYPKNFRFTVTHRDPRVMFLTRLHMRPSNTTNITAMDIETKLRTFKKNGYKSIISMHDIHDLSIKEEPGPHVPGDMPYGKAPIPLEDIYGTWPEAMCCSKYACPTSGPGGYRFTHNQPPPVCIEDPTDQGPLGMQATITTTKVLDEDYLFQLLFPRLIAFAERAWHRASWENTVKRPLKNMTEAEIEERKDFLKFKAILGAKILPKLDMFKVSYYLAPPGAILKNATADENDPDRTVSWLTDYPGFIAQVKTDFMADFEDIVDSKVYRGMVLEFRTRNNDSSRFSRVERMSTLHPDPYASEHRAIMHNFTRSPALTFPIQLMFGHISDPTGQLSFTITDNLPLFYDTDFQRYFNRTGFLAFRERKPMLLAQQQLQIAIVEQYRWERQLRLLAASMANQSVSGQGLNSTSQNQVATSNRDIFRNTQL